MAELDLGRRARLEERRPPVLDAELVAEDEASAEPEEWILRNDFRAVFDAEAPEPADEIPVLEQPEQVNV